MKRSRIFLCKLDAVGYCEYIAVVLSADSYEISCALVSFGIQEDTCHISVRRPNGVEVAAEANSVNGIVSDRIALIDIGFIFALHQLIKGL